MSKQPGIDQRDAKRFLERYPNGVTLQYGGLLDWGFARDTLYVAYADQSLLVMTGRQVVSCFPPHPPIVWENINFLDVEEPRDLTPLRDYLTRIIGDAQAGDQEGAEQ